jgi:predicted naringenin-chalcone synthase
VAGKPYDQSDKQPMERRVIDASISMPMKAALLGLGTAAPEGRLSQEEAARVATQCLELTGDAARRVEILYRRTGVATRGSVLLSPPHGAYGVGGLETFYRPRSDPEQVMGPTTATRMECYEAHAPSLAEAACLAAIEDAKECLGGLDHTTLTHLVVVSCTGFFAPGLDYALIQRLGLSPNIQRFCIGFMGCHGGFNGLQLATAIVQSDPTARVLLCSTELCSLHFQYSLDPGQITANALFADGAGAVVIGKARAEAPDIVSMASHLLGGGKDEMSWIIGDHGFKMHLSARVPGLIRSGLRPWLEAWLLENGLVLTDIGAWVVHPGGPRILTAVTQALDLDDGALSPSLSVLREHGNMSSATVWFIMEKLRRADMRGPCVLLGFGPGLVAEAALLRL